MAPGLTRAARAGNNADSGPVTTAMMTPESTEDEMSEQVNALERVDGGEVPAHVPDEPTDAGSLMQLAIREKVPVEVLERLMDLHERVEARNARAAFFDALSEFQDSVPEIKKSAKAKIATRSGADYSYQYAPLPEITRTIRPALKEHGLSYSWTTEPGEAGVLNVICVLRHVDGHEERASFPVPTATSAKMSEAQKSGAALTYGKRQSLTSVLGLTTADPDTDGADPNAGRPVNAGQIADLESLIEEVGADRGRFLQWLDVDSLDELTMTMYDNAVHALQAKRKAKEGQG